MSPPAAANGTARAVARGRKTPAALAGAIDMAMRYGATAEQVEIARRYPGGCGSELVTTTELIRLLEADGWRVVRQRGSHAVYRHPTKEGQLTVAVHKGKEVPSGTANSILKKAGLK